MGLELRRDAESVIKMLGNDRRSGDPRTIGVVVSLQRMGWLEPGPFIASAGELMFQPTGRPLDLNMLLFQEIADAVRSVDLGEAGML